MINLGLCSRLNLDLLGWNKNPKVTSYFKWNFQAYVPDASQC